MTALDGAFFRVRNLSDIKNNPLDEGLPEKAAAELERLVGNFSSDISIFNNMYMLYDLIDKESLRAIRQKGEWVLDGLYNLFEGLNKVIDDGKISPLSLVHWLESQAKDAEIERLKNQLAASETQNAELLKRLAKEQGVPIQGNF